MRPTVVHSGYSICVRWGMYSAGHHKLPIYRQCYMQVMTTVNFEFGAMQHYIGVDMGLCPSQWRRFHVAMTYTLKMAAVKEKSEFNMFWKFWHKEEMIVASVITDVYNIEVGKFSQKNRRCLWLLPCWWRNSVQLHYAGVIVCSNFQNRGTEKGIVSGIFGMPIRLSNLHRCFSG